MLTKPPDTRKFGEPAFCTLSLFGFQRALHNRPAEPNRLGNPILAPTGNGHATHRERPDFIPTFGQSVNYSSSFRRRFRAFFRQIPPPAPSDRGTSHKRFKHSHLHHGDERIRTADLLVANQPLSQLSYVPANAADLAVRIARPGRSLDGDKRAVVRWPVIAAMGLVGFEPTTSPLSGVRSNQLSYKPLSIGDLRAPIADPAGSRAGDRRPQRRLALLDLSNARKGVRP